jgi:hypothetical protein
MKNWSRKRATMKATKRGASLRQAALQAVSKKLSQIKKENKKTVNADATPSIFWYSLQ